MPKKRIYELAKQLNISNKQVLEKLAEFNIVVKNHMSSIDNRTEELLVQAFKKPDSKTMDNKNIQPEPIKSETKKDDTNLTSTQNNKKPSNTQHKTASTQNKTIKPQNSQNRTQPSTNSQNRTQPSTNSQSKGGGQSRGRNQYQNRNKNRNTRGQKPKEIKEPEIKTIKIPLTLTVKDLGIKISKSTPVVIKALMKLGIMVTINQEIDFETAQLVADQFHVLFEEEIEEEVGDIMRKAFDDDADKEEDLVERSPVVVVMGHVDHGKTSLLDSIRKSTVASSEAGGITQHIGAYTVSIDNKPITFLDTPGHEAFTAMRMRGAQVTDIAILVVAADDGVMPQTVEAINHAKAANIDIIVAINKIDKEGANPDRVKQELTEYGLVVEDWGGDTICVPVSALKKTGIDTLLEMIILVSEMKELKANPDKNARGTIIDALLDKGRGPVATVLVQEGTLKIGDPIVAGETYGKIRAMMDDKGRRVKEAGPSMPVEILGLSEVPTAGDMFYVSDSEKQARQVAESVIVKGRIDMLKGSAQKVSLDDLFEQIKAGDVKDLNIVVKADVQGSVEAVKTSLEKLSTDEVRIRTIHGGVGAITESDVMLASASNAIIIGFNVRPETTAKSIAEDEQVDVRLYRVIYSAIEDIQDAMKGMLDPIFEEKVIGHAEVRQLFKVSNVGTIAGSYITDGKFTRNASVRIMRDHIVIYEGELTTLKRFKDDVKEVNNGYECGLLFSKFNDVKEGDIVEAFIMQEIAR